MQSMTGFAATEVAGPEQSRTWEVRSVNARGLDIRMRLPEGSEALEAGLRKAIAARIARGNVSLALRVKPLGGTVGTRVNPEALAATLGALGAVEAKAREAGVTLAPTSAAQILQTRGVIDSASEAQDLPDTKALLAEAEALLVAFVAMRRAEGAALRDVLSAQVDAIEDLTGAATALREARGDHMAAAHAAAMARLVGEAEALDAARLSQDVATLLVKADITEELDRLRAHIAAARDLLAFEGPIGRKLDFLTQEFNREANTLCSKAQFAELTAIGLELKTVIDQVREQVQNVE